MIMVTSTSLRLVELCVEGGVASKVIPSKKIKLFKTDEKKYVSTEVRRPSSWLLYSLYIIFYWLDTFLF